MLAEVWPSGFCGTIVPPGTPICTCIVSMPEKLATVRPRCQIDQCITCPGVVAMSWYSAPICVALSSANWAPSSAKMGAPLLLKLPPPAAFGRQSSIFPSDAVVFQTMRGSVWLM